MTLAHAQTINEPVKIHGKDKLMINQLMELLDKTAVVQAICILVVIVLLTMTMNF